MSGVVRLLGRTSDYDYVMITQPNPFYLSVSLCWVLFMLCLIEGLSLGSSDIHRLLTQHEAELLSDHGHNNAQLRNGGGISSGISGKRLHLADYGQLRAIPVTVVSAPFWAVRYQMTSK
ncbi:unnamed protein product [Peniophora sp. CBMAI 1063]|nr:unnamed protein product [Peniophora sp. CBMAI 1063]